MRLQPIALLLAAAPLWAQALVPVQSFKLATGLTCLLVEDHERPLVRAELAVTWDPQAEPGVANGQVGFLASLMASGKAGPYSRVAFNQAVDELGLVTSFQGRRTGFRWSLVADSRTQEAAFTLLAHSLFRVAFDSPLVEAQRLALLKRAAATGLREGAIEAFLWSLQDPAALGVPGGAGLEQLELGALHRLQRHLIRPERATLLLYGDLSLAQAKELATLHLGVWGPLPTPAPPAPAPGVPSLRPFAALMESGVRTEFWAGVGRSEVSAEVGHDAGAEAAGEAVLTILLERLSRASTEDLQLEISLEPDGPLLIKAGVREVAKDALVPGLVALLESLRSKGFSQEELDRAKRQWQARQEALALHPAALAQRILAEGLEPDRARAVAAVSLSQVNGILAAWLQPARLRFLLLGADAELLKAADQAGLGAPELVRPRT